MLLLLLPIALAGKWDGAPTDIQADRVVPAPREQIFSHLLDLAHLRALFPADCVGLWEPGERTFGEGATAIVRYDIAAMHRKLPMTLIRADAPRSIDFDHLGPRGFLTRWSLEEVDGGTKVSLLTPINAPPWPFSGYYHRVIRPEWTECYARTLQNLEGVFRK